MLPLASRQTLRDLDDLCQPLFAIEYAEGSTGEDMRFYLNEAARAVRVAEALHQKAAVHYPHPDQRDELPTS